jgi:hypothetical protein
MKININKVKTMGQTKVPMTIKWNKTIETTPKKKPQPKPVKKFYSNGIGVGF